MSLSAPVNPLEDYFDKNNPAPGSLNAEEKKVVIDQVFRETMRRREKSAATSAPQYTDVVTKLDDTVCGELASEFSSLVTKGLAEWSLTQPPKKVNGSPLSSVYHRGPHGAEMAQDAKLLLAKQAKAVFNKENQQNLYIQMAAAAHAMHDIIQNQRPPLNEIESYKEYVKACNAIIDKHKAKGNLSEDEAKNLKSVADTFGWETIVVGTTFHFGSKRPVVDILNDAPNGVPPQTDMAVACATFACGKNDTRRMEVTLTSYKEDPELRALLDEQFEATFGDDNIVMAFMKSNPATQDDNQLFAMRHMIGQNCRMICEGKTHFGNGKDDLEFANFLTNLIREASTTFSVQQSEKLNGAFTNLPPEKVNEYFNKLINSFTGPFGGEIGFAKGLSKDGFNNAVKKFNEMYPNNAMGLKELQTGLWEQYGANAEALINKIKADTQGLQGDALLEYHKKVMCHFALYGGHQVGAALMRKDENLEQAYDNVIKNQKQALKAVSSNAPSDLKELKVYLDGLREMKATQMDRENVAPQENTRPQPLTSQKETTAVSKIDTKIQLCEGLVRAMEERELLVRQKLGLNERKSYKATVSAA